MATIYPFQPHRYTSQAGALETLVTQPYDKITLAMRERYMALNPYNLVRIILGKPHEGDSDRDNVYTRAAGYLEAWIAAGVLSRDGEAAVFPYFQEFTVPDTGERLSRKGFIALGAVEDYAAGVVYRHEQTLQGPKKDRLELLRHTRAHCGQIFMLYPDPAGEVDALLDQAALAPPLAEVADEYGAIHRLWRITGAEAVQRAMADKKLLIADGHHRYETALAYRDENPALPGAGRVMMTFVNMYSPGLTILATHRLVAGLDAAVFPDGFLCAAGADFQIREIASLDELKRVWALPATRAAIGAAIGGKLYLLTARAATRDLAVAILHKLVLGKALGITEEAVREGRHLRYMRGLGTAVEEARTGAVQAAFLLKPTSVEQVAEIAFSGGVMPQKSTDFYPKLLSGLTIYKL